MEIYIKLSDAIKEIMFDNAIDIEDAFTQVNLDFEMSVGIIPSVLKSQAELGYRTKGSDLTDIITITDESQLEQIIVTISKFLGFFCTVGRIVEQSDESTVVYFDEK